MAYKLIITDLIRAANKSRLICGFHGFV